MQAIIKTGYLLLALLYQSIGITTAQTLVISNVTIIDVRDGLAEPGLTVIVTGERITEVGPAKTTKVPVGTTVIDATGKYLIPGLWDMHVHIVSDKWVLPLLKVNGITGLRSKHGGERIQDVREKRKDGNYLGFEFSYSSSVLDGPPGLWSGSLIATTPDEGRAIVRHLYSSGYDFVKVYSNLSRDTYFAIAEECRKLNFPFAGHVPGSVSHKEAILAGQKSIEHSVGLEHLVKKPEELQQLILNRESTITNSTGQIDMFKWLEYVIDNYDTSRISVLQEIVAGSDTWFCPTLVNLRMWSSNETAFTNDYRLKYIPVDELAIWQAPMESGEFPEDLINHNDCQLELSHKFYNLLSSLLKPMLDSGAKFLAGTDIGNPYLFPGFSLHDELALFVEAGFTPLQALQTATINPAIYLNRLADIGTVEKGKIANLLLLDANPLEDIGNTKKISVVILNGRFFDRRALDEMLANAEEFARF